MATPAAPVDPFAGQVPLSRRTDATGTAQDPFRGFQQNGPVLFPQSSLAQRTTATGTTQNPFQGFQTPTSRIVAGVRPESQYRYNLRRMQQGRNPVFPGHIDPTIIGAQFLFGGR